eukprot:256136_1
MSVLGKRPVAGLDDEDHLDDTRPHKKQKLNQLQMPDDGIIVLNVGGVKYQTTIQTLTGYSSMLKARFSSKYAMKPSDDGSYFIDRDGHLFRYILQYLRTGAVIFPSTWKKNEILEFYGEAKYFMIESLFSKVLLKLFNSSIVTDETLTSKIVNKIASVLKCDNIIPLMESVHKWKCVGSTMPGDGFGMLRSINHSLSLVQSKYDKICGVFLTAIERDGRRCFDFTKSFAFKCVNNMYNFDIGLEYNNVRKPTDDETNEDYAKYAIGHYGWHQRAFNSIKIRSNRKNDGHVWCVRYGDQDQDKYETIVKSEVWSIPGSVITSQELNI